MTKKNENQLIKNLKRNERLWKEQNGNNNKFPIKIPAKIKINKKEGK